MILTTLIAFGDSMARRTEHPFKIERVLQPGDIIDGEIAVVASLRFAHVVFEVAVDLHPDELLIMRHGARIIRRGPAPGDRAI